MGNGKVAYNISYQMKRVLSITNSTYQMLKKVVFIEDVVIKETSGDQVCMRTYCHVIHVISFLGFFFQQHQGTTVLLRLNWMEI